MPTWTMRSYFRTASNHLSSFPNVMCGGLLHINVLARLASPNGLQGVPMIWRGENDGIDRFVVENASLIRDSEELFAGQTRYSFRCVQLALVAIADSGDFDILGSSHARQHGNVRPLHSSAHSHQADANSIVYASCDSDRWRVHAAVATTVAAEDLRNARRVVFFMVGFLRSFLWLPAKAKIHNAWIVCRSADLGGWFRRRRHR